MGDPLHDIRRVTGSDGARHVRGAVVGLAADTAYVVEHLAGRVTS